LLSDVFDNIPQKKWKYIFETCIMDIIDQNFNILPIIRPEKYNLSAEFIAKYELLENSSAR
jgi:hypothetical protein